MNTNKLQQQIAELTAKHEFEEYTNSILPGIKTLSILSNGKKRIVIEGKTKDDFVKTLSVLHPTNTETLIGSATKHEATLITPFRINIENPCSPSQYRNFQIEISYTSNDIDVDINLPIELVKDFVLRSERNITDSEYHYFTGTSMTQLRTMKVMCYVFNASQISWYGGNKTLTDIDTISNIIDSLK